MSPSTSPCAAPATPGTLALLLWPGLVLFSYPRSGCSSVCWLCLLGWWLLPEMFPAAGPVTCSPLSWCQLPSGLGLCSRAARGWHGARGCSPGSGPTWLGILSCAAAAGAMSELLPCSSPGERAEVEPWPLGCWGWVALLGMSACVSQRWDAGCWALTYSSRAVVPGSPTERCPALGSPATSPPALGHCRLGAGVLLGAPETECGVAWASTGQWSWQEAESAGKARLWEQERVRVLQREWEAGAPPCCGQGVIMGAALPCPARAS